MIIPLHCFAESSFAQEQDLFDQQVGENAIIVTGERVEATVRETSSSVAVVSSEELRRKMADRLDDVLATIPNVQMGSGESGPTIRGQDSTGVLRGLYAFAGGARPRVTVQVDGRPISFYEFVSGVQGMWDVDRVEVFRSPQTTTQGLNSIGGAIFVETGTPEAEWSGQVRARAGSLHMRQFSLVATGPVVSDQLSVRASGDIRLSRTSSDMADDIDGASIDRNDYGTARLKALYEPSWLPDLRVTATYAHAGSQAPQYEGAAAPFKRRVVDVPDRTNGVMRVNSDSVVLRMNYETAGGTNVSLTASGGDVVLDRFGLPGLGRARADLKDRTVELVAGRQAEPVGWLAGINLQRVRQDQQLDITGLGYGQGTFFDRQLSSGFFGQATWQPVARLTLVAGARYERDGQRRTGSVGPVVFDYDESFAAFLPKVSVAWDVTPGMTVGALAQRAFNPGGTSISLFRGVEDRFEEEYLWNYEIFSRGELASGAGSYTLNLFYNDMQDAQRQKVLPPVILPGGAPLYITELVNTPKARSYGLELELAGRLRSDLMVNAGLGLLDTRFVTTLDPDDLALGKEFEKAPPVTASFGIEWQPVETVVLFGQVRHHTGYFSTNANTPATAIDTRTVVDLQAHWTLGAFEAIAYARNLFDNFYLTYLYNPAYGSAGQPREIGLGLSARF